MEKINWSKAIGYGALIWIIMFVFVSLLIGIAVYDSVLAKIIIVLVAGALSYSFSLNIKNVSLVQAMSYGLVWVITGIVLDIIITSNFQSSIFGNWDYWLSSLFILFAPMINILGEKKGGFRCLTCA